MALALRTDRLEISPLVRADTETFAEYRREPAVARYQSWTSDFTVANAEAIVAAQPMTDVPAAGEWIQLGLRAAIGNSSKRTLIGDVAVGCDTVQPSTYEVGVTLASAYQGAGYASEALRCVIDWLMRECRAHRIVMQGDARNTSVLDLMRRLGLRHEGTVLEGDWFKDEWTTLERFALLHREWQSH